MGVMAKVTFYLHLSIDISSFISENPFRNGRVCTRHICTRLVQIQIYLCSTETSSGTMRWNCRHNLSCSDYGIFPSDLESCTVAAGTRHI
jgi:hypothetical protein